MKALILCVLIEIEGWKRAYVEERCRIWSIGRVDPRRPFDLLLCFFFMTFLFFKVKEFYRFSIAAMREKWILWRKFWKDKTTPNLEGNSLNESETEIIRPLKLYIILILKLQVFFFFWGVKFQGYYKYFCNN